jgi:conjugal transfer pilus assembly protein TraV
MKRTSIYASLILVMATLSGCSTFDSQNSKFACPNSTEGVRCYSAKQVYGMTNNSSSVVAVSPDDMSKNLNSSNSASSNPVAKTAAKQDAEDAENDYEGQGILLPEADKPLPVRMNAKVIRVKVFPYEDERGVFHAGDYLYAEVEGRKWTLTQEQTSKTTANANKIIAPLQATSQARPAQR